MNVEHHQAPSRFLNRNMEFLAFGHQGVPLLAIPTQNGHFRQWVDFGMVEVLAPLLEAGRIQLFLGDAIDEETISGGGTPHDRACRLRQYADYVAEELAPHVLSLSRAAGNRSAGMAITGCSGGAFHAANLYFRRPDLFHAVIALSGVYSSRLFWGDYMDAELYLHSPLNYRPNLHDPWHLDRYRQGKIVVCCGRGAWEHEMLRETLELKSLLQRKEIPAWIDVWGDDVNHDWVWWKRQLPYFLGRIL